MKKVSQLFHHKPSSLPPIHQLAASISIAQGSVTCRQLLLEAGTETRQQHVKPLNRHRISSTHAAERTDTDHRTGRMSDDEFLSLSRSLPKDEETSSGQALGGTSESPDSEATAVTSLASSCSSERRSDGQEPEDDDNVCQEVSQELTFPFDSLLAREE